MEKDDLTAEELWTLIARNQGREYRTARDIAFTYRVPAATRGAHAGQPSGELFIKSAAETVWSRKSITKATFFRAYLTVKELREAGTEVTGPKQLKVFGKTYIFAIFKELGLLDGPDDADGDCEQQSLF